MASLELRPRLATEIVDAAFQLYRHNFLALVTLCLVVYAPYMILEFAVTGGLSADEATVPGSVLALLALIGWIIGSFSEAAIVVAVSNGYLTGEPDPRGSLHRTMRRFGAITLAVVAKWLLIALTFGVVFFVAMMVAFFVVLATVAVTGGFDGATPDPSALADGPALTATVVSLVLGALLSVPVAANLFARYFAVPATVVLEGKGWRAGLKRSAELSKGMKRKVLGALGLPMLMFFVIQFVFVMTAEQLPGPAFIGFLVSHVPAILGGPLLAVIATLLYYDARIRKEGFDIERMATDLGSGGAGNVSSPLPVLPG